MTAGAASETLALTLYHPDRPPREAGEQPRDALLGPEPAAETARAVGGEAATFLSVWHRRLNWVWDGAHATTERQTRLTREKL